MKTKRIFVCVSIALLMFCISMMSIADEVSLDVARVVARNWLTHHLTMYGNWADSAIPSIVTEEVVMYRELPVAYNFTIQPGGHVLVAYWDEFSPVILYSTTSKFDPKRADECPSVESWVLPELYATYQTITATRAALNKTIVYSETPVAKAWAWLGEEKFSPLTERYGIRSAQIGPLLSTTWAQGSPYNQYTPGISGVCTHTYTGCVATAWSQVLKYWNWPDQGVGSHSYYWAAGSQTLSADFAHTYAWSDMPNVLTAGSTTAQKDAVARLMSDVGIAADMGYGCDGSSSNAWANDVLDVYFKYKSSMVLRGRGTYTASEWFAFFKTEFDANPPRPIVFSIFGGCGGHEVVADGYQTGVTNLAHVNLGWSGSYDGFYDVTNNFTTGSCTWNASSQVIVTNIEPDRPSSAYLLWTK